MKAIGHPVKQVHAVRADGGPHYGPDGKRCFCHGHCGECELPVVMNKMGKYVHVAEYRAR
jgi:hypothetical protein